MTNQTTLFTVLGAAIVLATGVALQAFRVRDIKEGDRATEVRGIGLADKLPRVLPGWVGRDEPLGPNEVVRTQVERVLNYDDYVFRVFERGGTRVAVYVAYWAPGRMPIQKVASHTPDRCWTENGWRCLDMRFEEAVGPGPGSLFPAQWRLFEPPAQAGPREFVLFWHLIGDTPYDYGQRFNATPHPVQWWRDTIRFAVSGSEAQFFIRVTSNRDFSNFADDPGWLELVDALAELGLRRPPV